MGCPLLAARGLRAYVIHILAIFYPPLKSIWGCVWLFLQAQKENIYFTELAERVEYGNYDSNNTLCLCVVLVQVVLISVICPYLFLSSACFFWKRYCNLLCYTMI